MAIRIIGAREGDPVQYNSPMCNELALLVVGDFSVETYKRDIVVQCFDGKLHQISALHPALMALQYPLLFPYGDRGFQVGVRYVGADAVRTSCRNKVTMQDYYRHFAEALRLEPGQKYTDRSDLIAKVYHMKLQDLLRDIKDGIAFGPINAGDDIQRRMKEVARNQNFVLPADELKVMVLDEISLLLSKHGASIKNYNLPSKNEQGSVFHTNRLIDIEMSYDLAELEAQSTSLHGRLNVEQLAVFVQIVECVSHRKPGFFFVSGFGGTGKTFLWNAVVSSLRSQSKIVLTVASSGVAALLLPGGRTTHSRFKIPLTIDSTTICDIKRGTMLAELIIKTSLVIWDEALMTHRNCFEALDRTFRDIMAVKNHGAKDLVFGGKVVVLGGDLRQILPIIEGGTRYEIVNASITNSPLWRYVKVLTLTINMRLSSPDLDTNVQSELVEFSRWVLALGEGKLPASKHPSNSEATWIDIPPDLLLHTDGDKIACIVSSVYPNFKSNFFNVSYLCKRAILAPTNEIADEVNSYVLSLVPGDEKEYLSCDTIYKSADTVGDADLLYPVEFLNSVELNNFPQHRLVLKKGVPIMLLRNLSQMEGLCNGTRLIVTNLAELVIEAVIITGTNLEHVVYIPRIVLSSQKNKMPFTLQRRQFPVKVSYAMTINKSQGQTLDNVGVYLKTPVFTHGQLYVAVSRMRSKKGLVILIENDDGSTGSRTKNIVYTEILSCLQ
ncbi:ATP-dependent DNA helicase PIF1-like [Phragmites australis]|uniref:ATP-dependent DNA helicase PIF1-like n=1 Tax=Phragmites australis TaxID=29695 RepID=UPI002D7710C5|nr:ATP-dependent DNA helicase PIF1-like [Phragmites australis]